MKCNDVVTCNCVCTDGFAVCASRVCVCVCVAAVCVCVCVLLCVCVLHTSIMKPQLHCKWSINT